MEIIKMLSVKNLSFDYDGIKIVDKFSYKFMKWKMYGIFWKSWLGKTTLAKLVSWFLHPSEWEISLNNKKVLSPSKEIVYLNQKDDTFYWLTIYDNLYLLCHDRKRVEEVLDSVGLYNCKNRYPKELSWWMVKRLSFARILLLRPKVLILDEPFIHLDKKAKENLIKLLLDIHKIDNYMIIVLISHNINEMKMVDIIINFQSSINWTYREKIRHAVSV